MRIKILITTLALAAACSDGSTPPEVEKEPALTVQTSVTLRKGVPPTCSIVWKAVPSKAGVVVHYVAGLRGYSVSSQGEFRDSTTAEWEWGGPWPVEVAWKLTSGAWTEASGASLNGC